MAPKRKATDVYSSERTVRAGTSRGNTWAVFDVKHEPAGNHTEEEAERAAKRRRNDVDIARAEAMDNIRRRTISMLRNSESNKPPDHKSRTIKWLIERFCAGELYIHSNSQRTMVCNVGWARQFISMLINSSTSVPAMTLRKVIESREVNGRMVNKEIFYVTDGAQRLTAILWFYLGLIEVDIIDKPAPRRSQRNISRNRRKNGVEANPMADNNEMYTLQFYDSAVNLMANNEPVFPMVYSPCDVDGVLINEDEQDVDDDHSNWCLDLTGPVYRDDAPDNVVDFFEKYMIAIGIGSAYYERQTDASNFASDEVRLRFLSREIGVDETCWSQQAGSHVNLWQSLQQYFFGVNELVSLVGDHASEWLKSLVGDLIDITGKWGVGHEMQMAYGALVRAFVLVHGAPRVPVQDDAPLWAFVIDYLGENFLAKEPSDLMKRRFAAAVRNITACDVPKRKDTRLNTDEVTLMIALTYHAIADEHLPDDIDDKHYRSAIIGTDDRARLAGHFAVMKAKGVKQKTTKLRSKFDMKSGEPHRLAEHLNSAQASEDRRNLSRYVRHVLRYIAFDAEQFEDEEDEDAKAEADAEPDANALPGATHVPHPHAAPTSAKREVEKEEENEKEEEEDVSDDTLLPPQAKEIKKEEESDAGGEAASKSSSSDSGSGSGSSSSSSSDSDGDDEAESSGDEAEEDNKPTVNLTATATAAPPA